MMCESCLTAAETGNSSLHCNTPGCTCQHFPVGDSRVPALQAQKLVMGLETPALNADLEDSPANHSRAGDTPTPVVRERQTF